MSILRILVYNHPIKSVLNFLTTYKWQELKKEFALYPKLSASNVNNISC